MKITKIKFRNWVMAKVETDAGIVGWGEGTVGRKTRAVAGCIDDLAYLILGQDPCRIEHVYNIMYRQYFWRPGLVIMGAMSAIETACWDILAKSLDVPLYKILGGQVRDKVRMYDHPAGGNPDAVYNTDTPEGIVEAVQISLDAGLDAVKVTIVPPTMPVESGKPIRKLERMMRALRDHVGEDVDLMVDFHGRTTPEMGIQYGRMLEQFDLLFMEEPCPPENPLGLQKVSERINIPLATGERLVTTFQFREIVEKQSVAIVQPDLCICGGLWQGKKIASMAETYYIAIAPHNPLGPISTAAALHFAFSTPNFLIQEALRLDAPWRDDVVDDPWLSENGYTYPREKPGLGVNLKDDAAEKYPFEQEKPYTYYHPDGSVADW